MKYLILSFKNAGFYEPESGGLKQNVSITPTQVSNMLHVLFGYLPVSSRRNTGLKRIGWIDELANDSLIHITTPMIFHGKFMKSLYRGKKYYPPETKRLNKSAWNSYRDKGASFVDWNILTEFIGQELANEFITTISAELGKNIRTELTAIGAIEETIKLLSTTPLVAQLKSIEKLEKNELGRIISRLDDTPVNRLLKNISLKKRTAFLRWILGYNTDITISKGTNLKITVTNTNGITFNFRCISGKMIIPMTDQAIDALRTGRGCATLLDGGYVHLDKLIDKREMEMTLYSDFININKLPQHEQDLSQVHP